MKTELFFYYHGEPVERSFFSHEEELRKQLELFEKALKKVHEKNNVWMKTIELRVWPNEKYEPGKPKQLAYYRIINDEERSSDLANVFHEEINKLYNDNDFGNVLSQ